MSSGTIQIPYPTDNSRREYYERTWNGGNDPKKQQENAYNASITVVQGAPAYQINPYYPYVPPYFFSLGGYGPNVPDLRNIANSPNGSTLLAAQSKARNAMKTHDFSASSALAEADQSVDLLLRACKNALGGLAALVRGDFTGFTRSLVAGFQGSQAQRSRLMKAMKTKDIARIWLAAQYGWIPLANDVMAAVEAFKTRNDGLRALKFKGRASSPLRSQRCNTDVSYPCTGFIRECVEYAIVLKEVPSPFRLMGFNNILGALWERQPLSFVFDWFLPIGQMLEEFSFFQGLNLTYRRTVYQVITGQHAPCWAYPPGPPTNQFNWYPGSIKWRHVNVVRTLGNEIGLTLPSLKSVEQAFSSGHLKNAAAMLAIWIPEAREGVSPRKFKGDISGRRWRGGTK